MKSTFAMSGVKTFIVTIAFFCTASCQQDFKPAYLKTFGFKYNAQRKALNIPTLDSSWTGYQRVIQEDSTYYITYSGKSKQDSFRAITKTVKIKDNRLVSDESNFEGKRKFTTVDGVFTEELFIAAVWDRDRNIDWQCEYNDPEL